ncbi:MAG: aminopeptidase P family protein [Clostridiales bacterium]|jgi:Xaa-Pro aminopeptidase|nr:aminopeptidase P family protein [Clostridiales bacterium]
MRPIISDAEFVERAQRTQTLLREADIDILLTYGNETEPQFVRYYSDYWPSFESAGVMMAQTGDPVLLIGPESMTYARDRSRIKQIHRLSAFRESSNPEYPGHMLERFPDVFDILLNGDRPKRVAIAGMNLVPHVLYAELLEALSSYGNVEIVRGDDLVMSLRMIKSPAEIACLRRAGEITAQTVEYVYANIRPGMTELQVRGLANGKMYELGAENESYPAWILAGEGGNQAISRARQKTIRERDFVHLQIGARYEGYASTIGRPVFFGEPDPDLYRAVEAGWEGYQAIYEQLRPGNNAGNVARAYAQTMKRNGHYEWLLYGPCHATGLMEGEPPWIEDGSDYILQENVTFCICLFMGNNSTGFGFRLEDSIRIGADGPDSLTNFRRDILRM